ncbi:hypothetical protein KUTeg_004420 [Tegillarca granosa]|uniref:Rho GTPase-activating protein 24 n=1 Tax=Tegillarca granosa TaxID=220873 RepID=A0ABQ9FPZ3_TEGGR|nr:hypothetical protein KUTeg_004420 [Tegillarca granosa]
MKFTMNNPVHRQRILKCGWLRKQGGMVKTWHRRWFCLNGDCLFYFAKHDDLKPLGSIFLPGNRVDDQPFNPDEPEKFLFEVLPVDGNLSAPPVKGRIQTKMAPNHDSFLLCAESDDERQEWIRAIRKVMYSGIGGAIFGQSIAETMSFSRHNDLKVPVIIRDCIEFLTEYGLEIEGIFRLPGRSIMIKEYKAKYDTAERVVFDISNIDVHSVASLLKLYLRELPESIVPSSNYQRFMNIALRYQDAREAKQKQEALEDLIDGMRELPKHNYNILKYLCDFLHTVGEKSSINKMTTINLATVFGPNIIRNVTEADSPELMMATADLTQQLAFMLIHHKDEVFTMDYDGPTAVKTDLLIDIDSELPNTETLVPTPIRTSSNDLVKAIFQHLDDNIETEVFSENVENSVNFEQRNGKDGTERKFKEGKPIPPKRRTKNGRSSRRICNVYEKTPSGSSVSDDMEASSLTLSDVNNIDSLPQENIASSEDQNNDVSSHQLAMLVAQNKKLEKELEEKEKENKRMQWEIIEAKSKFELENSDLKSKYEAQIKKLMLNTDALRVNYERRIESMQTENKAKVEELESKLRTEMKDKKTAVDKVIELQDRINRYQLQYGELHK